jgi:hypothetical protein
MDIVIFFAHNDPPGPPAKYQVLPRGGIGNQFVFVCGIIFKGNQK